MPFSALMAGGPKGVPVRRRYVVAAAALATVLCAQGSAVARSDSGGVPQPSSAAPSATPAGSGDPSPTLSPSPSAASPSPTGSPEGRVVVVAPNGYVEWGGSDPKINWVAGFEEATGCKVSYRPFAFDPAADQRESLDPTGFDVIAAPPDLAGTLVAARQVVPIDTSRVPGYDDIPKRLRDAAGEYGVPYLWDVTVVLRDKAKRKSIFKDQGPVMLRDTPLGIADAALSQGVKDPFQLSRAQFDDAMELLESNGDRLYWRTSMEVITAYATKEVRQAQASPYEGAALRKAGHKAVAKTAKGARTTGWTDSWMISAEADHPECAQQWVAWATSPAVQRKAAAWMGLAPANAKACTGDVRPLCELRPDDLKKVVFAVRPTKECFGRDGECIDYAEWVTRWTQLVS